MREPTRYDPRVSGDDMVESEFGYYVTYKDWKELKQDNRELIDLLLKTYTSIEDFLGDKERISEKLGLN